MYLKTEVLYERFGFLNIVFKKTMDKLMRNQILPELVNSSIRIKRLKDEVVDHDDD